MLGKDSSTGLLPLYLKVPCGEAVPPAGRFSTIVQWGIPARDPSDAYVLNTVKCLLRAKHEKSVREIWHMNGLKSAVGSHWVYEYRVAVFHQEALGVWARSRGPALVNSAPAPQKRSPSSAASSSGARRRGDRPVVGALTQGTSVNPAFRELEAHDQESYHVRRAKRDAVRAVYALGLVTGLVHIGIDKEGSTVVISADPTPKLDDRLAELFADAINRFTWELETAETKERDGANRHAVLLGADPEFVLRRPDGHFVSASKYLDREGTVGCDAVVLSRSRVIHPLAELRPKPSADPAGLVKELHRTMRQAAKAIGDPELAWLAGSMPAKGLPIGGHIHVSGVSINERLLRALDNYVALPLVLAEGAAAGLRRPRYGFLGDYRRKRHGGFEYRSLPSWLSTPELSLAVLTSAWLVALHYRELKQRPLERMDVQQAYYRGDKSELLPVVRSLWPELARLPEYGEYRQVLDDYRDRLFRLEGWNEQADFRIPWKIPPFQEKGSTLSPFVL